MLILNNDLIWKWSKIQASNKFSKKSQDDLQEKDATKWTHLYLDDKRIGSIVSLLNFSTRFQMKSNQAIAVLSL